MNHTSSRLRITGKFFALCLLTSASIMAMDNDDMTVEQKEKDPVVTLQNTEEEQQSKNLKAKFLQFVKDKGLMNQVQNIQQLSNKQMQKVVQSKAGRFTIENTKKAIALLKQYGLYDKVVPLSVGILGYALGEYVVPVTCVDLPGIRPSCVMTTTPFGGGICFPFASLVCSNLKYLSALGGAGITYLLTKKDAKKKLKKSE